MVQLSVVTKEVGGTEEVVSAVPLAQAPSRSTLSWWRQFLTTGRRPEKENPQFIGKIPASGEAQRLKVAEVPEGYGLSVNIGSLGAHATEEQGVYTFLVLPSGETRKVVITLIPVRTKK